MNRVNATSLDNMEIEVAFEKTTTPKTRPHEDTYGFGKYFTDHMFMCDYAEVTGWHSPRIVPYQPIRLDPGASVLHYGQALFEGMKAFRGVDGKIRLFRPEMNWKRLQAGAQRLCMRAPDLELFIASLRRFVRAENDWVPSKAGTALYLRPTLIGSEAFLGVRPAEAFIYYIIATPVGGYYGEGIGSIKIWVETEYSRCAPGGIGAVKAGGNYASSLLAALEAKKNGYAQVLWLDSSKKEYVEEVGTMNVFFKIGDRVITPPLSGTILPGVMRDSAIQMLETQGVPVDIRPISLAEVRAAYAENQLKEVFGTGTAASVSPVGFLGSENGSMTINDGQPGPVATKLYNSINDIQYGRARDDMGWTMEIPLLP
jgi:branched-chain amino acid aminotransferase